MEKLRKTRGITIIELIIICAIICILLAIFTPSYFQFRAKQRVRMTIRTVMEIKKALNNMAQECKGYPIRDDIVDETEFTTIIDQVECIPGKVLPAPHPVSWPTKKLCGGTSLGKMLAVETEGGSNALCVPACKYENGNCYFEAGGQKASIYSMAGLAINEAFAYVQGDECTPAYGGPAFGGGSPGWNYALLKTDADPLDAPVGVICAVGMGFKTPVKVIINTGGFFSGRQVQDGTAVFGLNGNYLGGSACPCGPYCENLVSGEKGCCASCWDKKGIGYNY
ncbi:hypothetical protein ACFLQK_01285 [bacterium]